MKPLQAGRDRALRSGDSGNGALFEPLEPRQLLAVPYGFTSFADLFDLGSDAPTGVIGASPSLDFVFTDLNSRIALINGVETPFASIPGVGPDGAVVGVNEAGLIVGAIIEEGSGLGQDTYGDLFIVEDGVRTMLSDAITSVVGGGGVAPDSFTLVEVGEDDSLLLYGGGDAWLLDEGVLTFLFDGRPIDMNANRDVVGELRVEGDPVVPVLRAADGTLAELTSLLSATAINDDGTIGGTIAGDTSVHGASVNTPVLLRDGQTVQLQPSRLPNGFFPGQAEWIFFGLDDQGSAAVRLEVSSGSVEVSEYYILAADGTLAPATDVTFGADAESPGIDVNQFAGTGRAVGLGGGRFLTPGGVIEPLDPPLPWTGEDGAPVHPAQGGGPTVAAQGELGDVLVIRNVGGQWLGSKMLRGAESAPLDDVLTYVDPKDGQTYVFALVDGRVAWGRLRQDREATLGSLTVSPPPTDIVDHATVFIAADGRVHLAGVDQNGDLIIFYQNNSAAPGAPANWSYNNLTEQHLEAQGLTFAPVASDLTAYVAPWGASHIAYLDPAGNVQVVWWAPGTTYWTTTNLTDAADATPLQGRITSYVTAWGGLNVAGTDLDGNLVALWWVPSFGGDWAFDRLAGDDAAKLDPASITSYVTPWGGLNIAGLDRDTGAATAYWWAPATNVWTVETISIMGEPADFAVDGALTSVVSGGDTQNLFAREETTGEIVRLFWSIGDGSQWTYESISDAAVLSV